MLPDLYTVSYESCSIHIRWAPTLCTYVIADLMSWDPGKGHATQAMEILCRWADTNLVDLSIRATPNFGRFPRQLNTSQLMRWLEKFGFELIDDLSTAIPDEMIRRYK